MKFKARIVLIVAAALLLAIVLIGAAPAQTTQAAAPSYHVVHWGETLYSIANAYGVNVWALACANGLYNMNYIYAGQVLYMPYGGGWYSGYGCQGSYHPVSPCGPYGCSAGSCYYGCPVSYQHGYDCWYRVRWGDTLSSIAWRYRTTYWTLAYANHLSNPNLIYSGMLLRIPGCN